LLSGIRPFRLPKLPIKCGLNGGKAKEKRQFAETNPLISFNDSIDFVERFQWFCSTIPLE